MNLKRMLKMLAAVVTIGAAMLTPLGAWADTWTDGSGNVWTYSGGTVTAVSFETTNLTIPDNLGGNTVTAFESGVFAGKTRAVRVTIPATVTAIPAGAFQNCENLKAVTIQGEGLTSIGAQAFKGCGNLEAFVMPNSVTSLGQGAFSGCSAMESVTLSDGLTTLTGVVYGDDISGKYDDREANTSLYGSYANGLFYNCTSLKTINWGKNIKKIGNIAFLKCSALESVTIPDTVTEIGNHAFLGCEKLANVKIGNGVTTVGRMAFRALSNLTKVTFGAKVNEIQQQAFQDCVNLQNFKLPDTIQHLRYRCFAGCNKALTEVTIPTNKDELETELEKGVFSGCTKLATVTFGDTLKTLTGVVYGDDISGKYDDREANTSLYGSYANGLFYNCTSLKTINWGKNVKTIGNIAFLNCSALEEVEIPDTVTSIGNHAFLGCANLANVKIGDGVTTIGQMAFRALSNLTKVTFGAKVNEIQQQAFQDCVNLQNFKLPNTIQHLRYRCFAGCNKAMTEVTIPTNKDELETELEKGVFSGCTKLATVTFGDTLKTLTGVVYGDDISGKYDDREANTSLYGSYANGLFYNCTSLKTINWGKNVKTIGNIAFLNCSALEKVEIPDSVTSIGCHAFLGCTSLTNVKIGDGVMTIGRMAFRALPNLTKVTFGAKVNEIGVQAFQDCVNLQNFKLPDTIQYLRYRCFAGCNKALTEVTIPTNKDELETELEKGVFSGCTKLATVTFGDTLKTLTGVVYGDDISGKYDDREANTSLYGSYANGLFYNCTSLKTINWGSGIKTIGNVAFLNCSALTDLVLPANITDIGNHAFFGCASLKTVVVEGNVNSIGRYAFGNCKALHYVDFRGSTMTSAPGYMPFKFDNDRVTAYVAAGSTGWTGVAEVGGLPENGTWGGARITYAPPPEGAENPYDFSLVTPAVRVSRTDYNWPAPIMVTTNRYVHERTIPQSVATIREGDPVYLTYAFDEYWRGEAFDVTNRFTLSGAKSGTFDDGHEWAAHATYSFGWKTNAVPELLQNLEPGSYTLTLQLNGDKRLKETDYSNNATSITFTVVGTPRYTVTFNLNGASGTAPAARTIYEGNAVGELPEVTVPTGWTFLGWYTATSGGAKVTASTKVTANMTCYALWSKCDSGFYVPTSDMGWSASMFVTSASDGTSPMTNFTQGTRIYLKYAFRNVAGEYDMRGFVNRFSLSTGAAFDDNWSNSTLKGDDWGWGGASWYPSELQNLAPGTYTLTCTLDATGVLAESDENNNTQSITFTVVSKDAPTPVNYTVTFNANGGTVSEAKRTVASGSAVGTLPTPSYSGYTFNGWFTAASGGTQVSASTKVNGNVTYYAHWTKSGNGGDPEPQRGEPVQVAVVINNITVYNITVIFGNAWGSNLPVAEAKDGYTFVGWFTKPDGNGTKVTSNTIVTEDTLTLYASYRPVDEVIYVLWETLTGTVPATAASVYDGCLYNANGSAAGSIQVKVAKPKNGTAKVTVTVTPVGGRKKTLRGVLDVATGKVDGMNLTLGAYAMDGSVDGYTVDGARSLFSSKSSAEKSTAASLAGKWPTVSVAWGGGTLTVTTDKKGKAKIAGNLASGTKVSAKSQMLIGESWCCVPVVWSKMKESVAFTLWLRRDGGASVVAGLDSAEVGAPSALKGGAAFRLDADALCALLGDSTYKAYLPNGVSVAQSGARWTVANGARAGKVQLGKDGNVDATKAGANASALKLTYKAKDGTFKGSFKAYTNAGGRPKATTINVTGVMVGGKGYGMATVKSKKDGVAVTIE